MRRTCRCHRRQKESANAFTVILLDRLIVCTDLHTIFLVHREVDRALSPGLNSFESLLLHYCFCRAMPAPLRCRRSMLSKHHWMLANGVDRHRKSPAAPAQISVAFACCKAMDVRRRPDCPYSGRQIASSAVLNSMLLISPLCTGALCLQGLDVHWPKQGLPQAQPPLHSLSSGPHKDLSCGASEL
jgi:hypothetical protein